MVVLRIQHAVPDFEGWLRAFRSDPVDRKGAGVRYLGSRVVADADGVPVDLLFGGAVLRTNHTTDGAFRFTGLPPGGYFARARIFGSLGVTSGGLTVATRDVAAPDPLVLESVGDLYPAPTRWTPPRRSSSRPRA